MRQMRSITAADPKARADIEDNFRKTIGQLIAVGGTLFGAAVVLISAALAYLQFTQQQRTTQQQFTQQQQASQEQFLKQQQASHDLLISNQVSKGFEQFGSDNMRVRLGGIYALEGVMNTSKDYHKPVLEALSAFVRDGTRTVIGDGQPPTTDIQAALTVIGRRAAIGTGGKGIPNLANAHFPKADLLGADLSTANLYHACLNGVDLYGAELAFADLTGAHLYGADVRDVILTGAHLSLADVRVADLTGADLTGADLYGAFLTGAKITQAQLDQACGTDVKLDPGLTIKPCPPTP
jgi:uncharacterized protein YjbI with pentapeptide repeats